MISVSSREEEVREATHGLVQFAKGDSIYHQGDVANQWFEVVSGMVRTCRFMADGHRQLTGFHYSGDVFGVEGDRHCESAEAVTDVIVRRTAKSTPCDGADDVPQPFEKALESARRSIFLFGHRTATNRVAAFLMTVAQRSEFAVGVQLPMTRSDIADHLNLTLHTVSRTIRDFAKKGLIELNGRQHLRILDPGGLRRLAGDAAEDNGDPALPGNWSPPPGESRQ